MISSFSVSRLRQRAMERLERRPPVDRAVLRARMVQLLTSSQASREAVEGLGGGNDCQTVVWETQCYKHLHYWLSLSFFFVYYHYYYYCCFLLIMIISYFCYHYIKTYCYCYLIVIIVIITFLCYIYIHIVCFYIIKKKEQKQYGYIYIYILYSLGSIMMGRII